MVVSAARNADFSGMKLDPNLKPPLRLVAGRQNHRHPWTVAIAAVIGVVVLLTFVLGVWSWQRGKAKRHLENLIKTAEARDHPAMIIEEMEQYIRTHPPNKFSRRAAERLQQAKVELDDYDFRKTVGAGDASEADLDSLEISLRDYLERHPEGRYRNTVESRLNALPTRRDDLAYRESARKAETGGDDLEAVKAAWQAYLDSHPGGRHAAEAQAQIAQLPERAEKAFFQKQTKEIRSLIAADRIAEALDQIDLTMIALKSQTRRDEISKLTEGILAQMEATDAAGCLIPVPSEAAARDRLMRACRLFLLCYPTSRHQAEIEEVLKKVAAAACDEVWGELESSLVGLEAEPTRALKAIDEYQERTGDRSERVALKLAAFRAIELYSTVDGSLARLKIVHLKSGPPFLAESAEPFGLRYLIRLPDGKRKSLLQTEITGVEDPPLFEEIDRLRRHSTHMLAHDTVSLAQLKSLALSVLQVTPADLFPTQRQACEAYLATLNAGIKTINRASQDRAGRSEPRIATSTSSSNSISSRSPSEVLASFSKMLETAKTTEEEAQKGLPDSYQYQVLGKSVAVPIRWNCKNHRVVSNLMALEAWSFHGKVVIEFKAEVERVPGGNVPSLLYEDIDNELKSANAALVVVNEYEIRGQTRTCRGVGVKLEERSGEVVVAGIYSGSEAAHAGLESGDRVVAVDRVPVLRGAKVNEVMAMIANGPPGGVELGFQRLERRFYVHLPVGDYSDNHYEMRESCQITPTTYFEQTNKPSEWIDIDSPP